MLKLVHARHICFVFVILVSQFYPAVAAKDSWKKYTDIGGMRIEGIGVVTFYSNSVLALFFTIY